MGNGTVGIDFAVRTGNAKGEVDTLSSTVGGLTQKLKEATAANNWQDAFNITKIIDNLAMADKAMGQGGKAGNNGSGSSKNKKGDAKSKIEGKIVDAVNKMAEVGNQIVNGNIAQATASSLSGGGSFLRGLAKDRRDAGKNDEVSDILGKLGVAGQVLGTTVGFINGIAGKYEEANKHMVNVNRLFAASENEATNAVHEMAWFDFASGKHQGFDEKGLPALLEPINTGTGLETADFLDAVAAQAQYGYKEIKPLEKPEGMKDKDYRQQLIESDAYKEMESRMKNVAKMGQTAYATGVDISVLQDYAGNSYRYGRGDKNAALQAYQAINNGDLGLGKGQFEEFIQGLGQVLEDGISKGFYKSAQEVSSNLRMFESLTKEEDKPFWEGKQGIQRMQSMGNALADATNLGDTGDMILYEAAKTAYSELSADQKKAYGLRDDVSDDVNVRLLMERGLTPEVMTEYFKLIKGMYGTNTTGIIDEIERDLNLNTTGAAQLYAIEENFSKGKYVEGEDGKGEYVPYTPEDFKKALEELSGKYASNETATVEALNKLNNAVVHTGKGLETAKVGLLTKIANLVAMIAGGKAPNDFYFTGAFSEDVKSDRGTAEYLFNEYKTLKDGNPLKEKTDASILALERLQLTNSDLLNSINVLDMLNDVRDLKGFNDEVTKLSANDWALAKTKAEREPASTASEYEEGGVTAAPAAKEGVRKASEYINKIREEGTEAKYNTLADALKISDEDLNRIFSDIKLRPESATNIDIVKALFEDATQMDNYRTKDFIAPEKLNEYKAAGLKEKDTIIEEYINTILKSGGSSTDPRSAMAAPSLKDAVAAGVAAALQGGLTIQEIG